MAWFVYSRLYAVSERLWHTLRFLWRCAVPVLCRLLHRTLTAVGWRRDHGSSDDSERCPKEKALPPVNVEESDREGQREAAAGQRGPAASERPGREEEDDFSSESYRVETTDELYCGYDSTWETEEHQGNTFRSTRGPKHYKFSRFENAARDMQNYRHGYPPRLQCWQRPISDDKPNLEFYLGFRPSLPDGVYIHHFHNEWSGDYDALEYVHTYIQWLFPLQEPGMNNEASPLTKEEIKDFLQSSTAKENLLKSYKLMLDFYGIKLCDETTGEVERAQNWRSRFHNLNSNTHNNLRITRILKCQGILGYPHYQAPLVHFFLKETLVHGELPKVKESVLNYFVFAVLDRRQRRSLIKFAYMKYDRKDEFVWCPKKIQMRWSGLSECLSPDNEGEAAKAASVTAPKYSTY